MALHFINTLVINYIGFIWLQDAALQGNVIATCLEQLSDPSPSLRQWLALCLGKVYTFIYTVQLLVLRRRFIKDYSFNSILYYMKKGHSTPGYYCSECLLATKNWSFKLFSFLSLHVKHFEFCWYAFIFTEMVSLGLLKCWEISLFRFDDIYRFGQTLTMPAGVEWGTGLMRNCQCCLMTHPQR